MDTCGWVSFISYSDLDQVDSEFCLSSGYSMTILYCMFFCLGQTLLKYLGLVDAGFSAFTLALVT